MLPVLALLALPLDGAAPADVGTPPAIFDPVVARGAHLTPGEPRALSKKEEWLREKLLRPDLHTSDADIARAMADSKTASKASSKASSKSSRASKAKTSAAAALRPGERIEPVTTLYNVWTHEALPILPGTPTETYFHTFLRDHFTNQATHMDTRLVDLLKRVADRFSAKRIEVVSGYRSPKYNLMLRKKGHQVARHSQHMEGNAVDFRVRGVATRQVLHFVRSLHMGGVGFYPHSQFVHGDTGKIRYWTGS